MAVTVAACTGNPVESNGEVAGGGGGGDSGDTTAAVTSTSATTATTTTQGSAEGSTSSSPTTDPSAGPTGEASTANAEGSSGDEPGSSSNPVETVTLTGLSETEATVTTDVSGGEGSQDTGGCDDPYEPNDDSASAVDLGGVDCHDAPSVLDAALDVNTGNDWYRFTGEWTCDDFEDGLATVTVTNGNPARVCLYPDCVTPGTTYYACPIGDDLGDGICCTANGEDTVQQYVNCPFTADESVYVWVYVESAGQSCEPYSLDYGYGST